MKIKKILSIIAVSSLLFSCEDNMMEWYDDPTHGDITRDELPLALKEAIGRYASLDIYADSVGLKLGVGVGSGLYLNSEYPDYSALANENFHEVTVGYNMKHGPMVKANGELDFEHVDEFVTTTKNAGLSIYGHCLMWHANQNASYLNGLIAPTVIPGSLGTNLLPNGSFDENKDGWSHWGSGEFYHVTGDEALAGGGAFQIINTNDNETQQWKTQAQSSFTSTWIEGHTYIISIYVRSETNGMFRLSTLNDGAGGSTHYLQDEGTTSSWNNYSYEIVADGHETGLSLDFGGVAGTYYVDHIEVVDKDAPSEVKNFISNGDFETGNIDGWGGWGGTREVSSDGQGYGDQGYAMVLTRSESGDLWSMQTNYSLSETLENGTEYTVTFMAKSNTAVDIRVQLQSEDYASDAYTFSIGTTWALYQAKITTTSDTRNRFVFDTGAAPAEILFDDVVLTDGETGGSEPIIIEKTDEEKKEIIDGALDYWISEMVGHYKTDVTVWDVVNEPMKENGEVRDGNVNEEDMSSDHFYWQKYLGPEDYAARTIELTRQYGNANDILFINDYNLEGNMTKLDGLIDYVGRIEQKGQTVDGIGTQMHVSYKSDTTLIKQMFEKLAATGKLIKVSELDVRLGTKNPTTDQLAAQCDMYRFIMEQYLKIIPESQQYGITIWGVSDNEVEHEYWLPDESPNLWDANWERKHAYKGVADGIMGKDISADFSGDLE